VLTDIVIDTNVFVQATNPNVGLFNLLVQFLEVLPEVGVLLCLDEGYDPDPALNKSLIYREYCEWIIPGSLGFTTISEMASNRMVSIVSRRVDPAISRRIGRMIADPRDRTFVKVAFNSIDHVLASHDETDFPEAIRDDVLQRFGVSILMVYEVRALLT
jgi:predicted nucleic acid-binding protein